MASIKIEVNPEYPNPHNCRMRNRETAERLVDCPEKDCIKQKVFRAVRSHWKEKHSVRNLVLALKCTEPGCGWFCYHTLRCFSDHMRRIHDIHTTSNSDLKFTKVIPRFNKHSGQCSSSSSDAVDLQREMKKAHRAQIAKNNRALRLAAKQAKAAEKLPRKLLKYLQKL